MNEHLSVPAPAMRDVGVEEPAAVEGIVRHCLRKQPADRYPNATALAHDLEHWRELDPSEFAFSDETAMKPPEEHLLLLVAAICVAFLTFSTLFVTAAYLVQHR